MVRCGNLRGFFFWVRKGKDFVDGVGNFGVTEIFDNPKEGPIVELLSRK